MPQIAIPPISKRLGFNTLWLLVARLGGQGLLVVFTILVARNLGNVGLGQYAFIASAIFQANTLTTFGTDMLLIREIAAGAGLYQLPAALMLQLILSGLCAAIIAIVGPLLLPTDQASATGLAIYGLSLFPLAFFTVFTTALRGLERMYWYAVLNLLVALAQAVGAGLFFRGSGSIVGLAWLLVAVQTLAAVLAGGICWLQIPGFRALWHFQVRDLLPLVRASAPIALLALLGMLYLRLSVYQVTFLAGAAVTGWFSGALRLVEALKTGHLALFGALYPALARSAPQAGRPARLFSLQTGGLLLVSLILSLVLFVLAGPLVHFLYGSNFEPSIDAAKILAWIIVPYALNSFLSLAFLAQHREGWVARALLGSLVTLAVLNFWWLPAYGLAGACWAALAAETAQTLVLVGHYAYAVRLPQLANLPTPTA